MSRRRHRSRKGPRGCPGEPRECPGEPGAPGEHGAVAEGAGSLHSHQTSTTGSRRGQAAPPGTPHSSAAVSPSGSSCPPDPRLNASLTSPCIYCPSVHLCLCDPSVCLPFCHLSLFTCTRTLTHVLSPPSPSCDSGSEWAFPAFPAKCRVL